jgi:catalase
VIGAWGEGVTALERAACPDDTGIVRGDDATEVLVAVQELMARHRVWERFEPSSLRTV